MAMNVGPADGGDDDEQLTSAINTTPLVDVMLVLLIIFLITIPVVTHTVPVALPSEVNQPTKTKPENIVIAVDKDGQVFWNDALVRDTNQVLIRLQGRAGDNPQPEVHIRADKDARYEYVGTIMKYVQQAGIQKVAFIIQPDRGSATVQ